MMPLRQGANANKVQRCTYLTWSGLVARHNGNLEKASKELEECMRDGLWEEHAHVKFVLVDCYYALEGK